MNINRLFITARHPLGKINFPVFAVAAAVFEAVGSAAVGVGTAVVGAGGAAAAGGLATGLIGVGVAGAVGVGIASAAGAFTPSAKASTINPNPNPTAAQTVDNAATSNVNNLGRAALISTSPQGVQGSDPSNRYALLGNSQALNNSTTV